MKRTQDGKDKISVAVIAVAIACVLALIAVFVCMNISTNRVGKFVPPPFEPNAEQGLPDVPDGLGWNEIYQEGMDFRAKLTGSFIVQDSRVNVYFANTSEEAAWLKLCVMNENGDILGETGIIKQNEYVKSVVLDTVPQNSAAVTMKIMAYEPETYYSLGAVRLNTTVVVE